MSRGRRDLVPLAMLAPTLAVLVPFFVVPLAVLVRNSFNRDDPTALMVSDVTWMNYAQILGDAHYARSFANSAGMAGAVTIFTLLLGYPFAYYLVRYARRSRPFLQWVIYTPLVVSAIVRVFGWMVITADSGVINSALLALRIVDNPVHMLFNVGGLVLGLTHRYLPLMVLPIANALGKIDPALLAASAGLGAGNARTFLRVALPLSLPGVVVGGQLVFAAVLSDFVLPLLMGSTRFRMLAPAIFDEAIANASWASAAAMAVVMLAAVGLVLGATTWSFRRLAPWARTL